MDYIHRSKIAEGIVVIVLAALLLADGIMGSIEAINLDPLFSLPVFKFIVGLIALVLGAAFVEESRRKPSAS